MLNYYCTWNAQNCARPDAVLEPSAEVFLGADGAKKVSKKPPAFFDSLK